jgi:hypothetical protein
MPDWADELIAKLKDRKEWIRRIAAEALGRLGDPRAVGPLIVALKDSHWEVRRDAAESLGKLGDSRAVEPLMQTLKDSDAMVRWRAAEALSQLGCRLLVSDMQMRDRVSAIRSADGNLTPRKICNFYKEYDDAQIREAAWAMLAYLDSELLIPTMESHPTDSEQLLRMQVNPPDANAGDELLRQAVPQPLRAKAVRRSALSGRRWWHKRDGK